MDTRPVLVGGAWRAADATSTFRALNPTTGEPLAEVYPVSSRADVDAALVAGRDAARELESIPDESRARFLELYADAIEAHGDEIAQTAADETALPFKPRLRDGELLRTSGQLRQAAAAVREGSWREATIDTKSGIRSALGPLGGPVVVFGPNNFPLAFNGVSGGDFAAAIAAGNPVIAKAHPSHPSTSRRLAEEAFRASQAAGLPPATVQLLYRTSHADGEYLVSHPLVGATGYTGARKAGLVLKRAADAVGKPIYLELSSVNPVLMLPGAIRERSAALAEEYAGSVLLGAGQFCTNPGVLVVVDSKETSAFLDDVRARFEAATPGTLLGPGVLSQLASAVTALVEDGAELLAGGAAVEGRSCAYQNTLLRVRGEQFLAAPEALQREAFGNAALVVVAASAEELERISDAFEGNLTGSVYSSEAGADDALHDRVAPRLRRRVGRLLNDKMPTGVAVCSSMNHGGPFPATGHPGFTAVGIPGSIRRFAMLECYDNVRPARLPAHLRDRCENRATWRLVDGAWTRDDIA